MQASGSMLTLDGLLTPVAMLFELLAEVQAVGPGAPAGPREQAWRQSFHDTLKATGSSAQEVGLKSIAHLAALLGPYLRRSSAPGDLTQAHALTASIFSFLAGDLTPDEASDVLDQVSKWVAPLTPLPLAVRNLVASSLLTDGELLRQARLKRLDTASQSPSERPGGGAGRSSTPAKPPVTVALDELAMVAAACQELVETAGPWSEAGIELERLCQALVCTGLDDCSALLSLFGQLMERVDGLEKPARRALDTALRRCLQAWALSFDQPVPESWNRALLLSGKVLHATQRDNPGMIRACRQEFESLRLVRSRQVAGHQPQLGEGDLSLALAADIDPQVVRELFDEIPRLSRGIADHLKLAVEGSLSDLGEARRLAHSLKGGAQTAGISGLTRYAHALEDLLQLLGDDLGAPGPALKASLLEASGYLVSLCDAATNGARAPSGFEVAYQRIVAVVNEGAAHRHARVNADMRGADAAAHGRGPSGTTVGPGIQIVTGQQESARVTDPAWRSQVSRDAEKTLLLASLREQVVQLEAANRAASDLPVLQVHVERAVRDMNRQLHQLLKLDEDQDVLELDEQALSVLVPRLQQVVRQASLLAGKTVMLVVEGEGLRVPPVLLQQLADPLSHLLRNAIDHGIELTSERVRLGKPGGGQLHLRFIRHEGQLAVELADDGQGLDLIKIRDKAVAMGLVSAADAIDCTDEQVSQWIFAAGLSTKSEVGTLSGRGVGMDVVRQSVDRLNGELMIETEAGKGTTVHLLLPLTARGRQPGTGTGSKLANRHAMR